MEVTGHGIHRAVSYKVDKIKDGELQRNRKRKKKQTEKVGKKQEREIFSFFFDLLY